MTSPNEALLEAITRGDAAAAAQALAAGASANYVNSSDENSWHTQTPVLYQACDLKKWEIVQLLLAHGADPNAIFYHRSPCNWEKFPCLFRALDSLPTLEALLQAGADPNALSFWREDCHNETHILSAASDQPEAQALLRRYGADPARGFIPECP